MDTSDPDIVFDADGVCNHCHDFDRNIAKYRFTPEAETQNLAALSERIRAGKKGPYDSLVGLSGGVDSSYVCYLAHKMGLNPLCVHFDNGWNSKTAVSNIKKIVEKCGYDLDTYVINWPEFRDLQRSYIKAGVIDIEMLSDHAIMATMYKIRKQNGIPYVLSGTNFTTEHGMPNAWVWRKSDLTNIKGIQQKFGTKRLKEFPTMGTLKVVLSKRFKMGGEYVEPLNAVSYSKEKAMEVLNREFGWEYYGGKHYESVWTKFYQAYILPVKFGVDKRKTHLSALIRNGEISRDAALQELSKPPYDPNELKIEKDYVLKKLGFSEPEFDSLMQAPPKQHLEYGSNQWMMDLWAKVKKG